MQNVRALSTSAFKATTRKAKGALPQWFSPIEEQAQSAWNAATFPTRKTEDWRHTSLAFLNKIDFFSVEKKNNALSDLHFKVPGLQSFSVVFVNGYINEHLSDLKQINAVPGVSVTSYADANSTQQALIEKHTNTALDTEKHIFSSLNLSQLDQGLLIHISANTVIDMPIHVVSITSPEQDHVAVSLRSLVVLEAGAEVSLIEHFLSSKETTGDSHRVLINQLSEYIIGVNARLNHYRIHEEADTTIHIGGAHAKLNRSAHLNSFYMAFGTGLTRQDVGVLHQGEGAHAAINGIYLPKDKQHIDFHTCIEHAVPHCTSTETFRGIVADQSRAVFNGRIHIHRHAQKTEAFLSNKNLLTSNKAEVDTKPELEIYADDVRCAHGATVAQMDDDTIHYLRTRGIGTEEAKSMISFGFINELLSDVKHSEISDYLRPKIANMFASRNAPSGRLR